MLQKTPLLLFAFGAFAQTPNFDGIVDEDEWQNAQRFSISHEIELIRLRRIEMGT
tara:strand:+ start:1393 stop:1557 length:165 start_codon:yes stop_codon:yes gene_type:complete